MNRSDIQSEYTWDLSHIYANDEQFDQDILTTKQLIKELVEQQTTFLDTEDSFYHFLIKQTKLDRLLSKLYCYCHLYRDVEPDNQIINQQFAKVMSLYEDASQKLTFVDLKIIENKEQVLSYLTNERFKDYRKPIEETLRLSTHILDQKTEDLLSLASPILETGSDVFEVLRPEFEPVIVNGKEEFLNQGTLSKFLKNENEEVRKQAYHNFFKEYQKYESVYAKTLASTMKKDAFYAKVRKFDNALQASLFADDVPTTLFYKILEQANQKHIASFHRYNKLKKKLLNKETLYNYDLNVPLVSSTSKNYSLDEAFELIFEATKPFGKEYHDLLQQARKERWIDYYPHNKKAPGAYSSGCYDTSPYVLMSFIGDFNSVSTLIHELGHSCHTALSTKYQPAPLASYRIFVAEVASTVNEMLLIQHMIKHAQNEKEKAELLYNFLENCVGLIYRQPFFANFENILHVRAQNNESLASKDITDLFEQLNRDYFGEDVTLDEYARYSCYYVPHFYYNYYVYKYTVGACCALAIASRIQKGDQNQIDHYLQFLKSGCSLSPIELLKLAGVNPLEDELYDEAFNYFDTLLNEFETIMLK